MSDNKVTKEMMKKLVEGLLNEKEKIAIKPFPIKSDKDFKSHEDTKSWFEDFFKDFYKGGLSPDPRIPFQAFGDKIKNNPEATSEKRVEAAKILLTVLNKDGTGTDLSDEDVNNLTDDQKEVVSRFLNALALSSNNARFPDKAKILGHLQAIVSGVKSNVDTDEIPQRTALKDKEVSSISSFSFSRLESSDASVTAGEFLGSQNELINSIFAGMGVKSRIEKLSQTSKDAWDLIAGGTPSGTNRENVQKLMMVDLINSMVNEIDSRAGAYFFEGFCALLFGGKVIGGSMGGADFEIGDTKGSSKFYSSWSGFGQAVSNFEIYAGDGQKPGKIVHYLIIIKDKSAPITESDKEAREGAVYSFNMHYIGVKTMKGTNPNTLDFTLVDHRGNIIGKSESRTTKKGSKLKLSEPNYAVPSLVGSFQLYSGSTQNFSQALDDSLENTGAMSNKNNLKDTITIVRDYFDNMFQAEENTKKYINMTRKNPEEILSVGQEALRFTDKASSKLDELVVALSPKNTGETTIGNSKKGRTLSESKKITSSMLRKIIEENLKK